MNAPLATVKPHPTIKDGYTLNDPVVHGRPYFATKERAEIAAAQRNKKRRKQNG